MEASQRAREKKVRTTMFLEVEDFEFIRKMAYLMHTTNTGVVKAALDAFRKTTTRRTGLKSIL